MRICFVFCFVLMFYFRLLFDRSTVHSNYVLKKYFIFCGIFSNLDSCWWDRETNFFAVIKILNIVIEILFSKRIEAKKENGTNLKNYFSFRKSKRCKSNLMMMFAKFLENNSIFLDWI